MKLSTLLSAINMSYPQEMDIQGLSLNSNQVEKDFIFCAVNGDHTSGTHFIQAAIERGASCILYEAGFAKSLEQYKTNIPLISVPQLHDKVGVLAQVYYNAAMKHVVGITGTNGKTTCAYLLAQALNRLGSPCAMMGTLGVGMLKSLQKTGLTTPPAIDAHRYLAALTEQGAESAAIEVSSHALSQGRVNGISFESAMFTNLTQDHLDYHGDMVSYGWQKSKLFTMPSLRRVILNADDPYSINILNQMRRDIPVVMVSLNPAQPKLKTIHRPFVSWVIANQYQLHAAGSKAQISTPWGEGVLQIGLLGEFNLSNALMVLSECCLRGYSLDKVLGAMQSVQAAPGRMQSMGGIHTPRVIIDYAHTPEALRAALLSAREHCKRRLWVVFGCGGDRDASKRSQMGEIAAKLADRIVLTNDNPRYENPRQIIGDILHGMQVEDSHKVVIQEARDKAIEHAIVNALPVDTVLVAGKGHEDTQTIGNTQHNFSDIEYVQRFTGKQTA